MSASSTKVNLATLTTLGPGARCRAEGAVSAERDERAWSVSRPRSAPARGGCLLWTRGKVE
eukprot:11395300-Prorocentrum_lima.AAC.1